MTDSTTTYTDGQLTQAVYDGIALVTADLDLDLGERDTDLINLCTSTILTRHDQPGTSLGEVIRASHDTDPDTVRGWWTSWA